MQGLIHRGCAKGRRGGGIRHNLWLQAALWSAAACRIWGDHCRARPAAPVVRLRRSRGPDQGL